MEQQIKVIRECLEGISAQAIQPAKAKIDYPALLCFCIDKAQKALSALAQLEQPRYEMETRKGSWTVREEQPVNSGSVETLLIENANLRQNNLELINLLDGYEAHFKDKPSATLTNDY